MASRTPLERFARVFSISRFIVPLLVAAMYLWLFGRFLVWLLPEDANNVNFAFADGTWRYFLVAGAALYLGYFLYFKIRRKSSVDFEHAGTGLHPADLALVLLPLTPIVQYVLHNQDILDVSGSFIVIGVFAGVSVLLVLVIPALFSIFSSARILAFVGLAFTFTFTITNMASMTAYSRWYEQGELKIQLALFFAIFAVGLAAYSYVGRRFTYLVVVLYFVANSVNALPLFQQREEEAEPVATDNKMVEIVGTRTPPETPNIYLLVYDSYVSNETMLGYGIDNSAQEEYLGSTGFTIYPQSHSISAFTVATMSPVFSVTRPYDGLPRDAVSGDGVVHRLLQSFGYKTHGVFWSDFFFQEGGCRYDHSYPGIKGPHWLVVNAIFMGEFRFDFEFAKASREEFLKSRRSLFGKRQGDPVFVYMHDNLPGHSQNSGVCLPDETELFESRLAIANETMKNDIDLIMQTHPDAIIVVAGDHGPYLTKNCGRVGDQYDISEVTRHDVQDRYGAFLAIRWPDQKYTEYDEIVILQDLFPAIFGYLFEDRTFLEAKIDAVTGSSAATTAGVMVIDGVFRGGVHDGEPLFLR